MVDMSSLSGHEMSFPQVERRVWEVVDVVVGEVGGAQGLLGEARLVYETEVRGETVREAVLDQDVVDHCL